MVERHTAATMYRDCKIAVVTEQLTPGVWAVAVSVTHSTDTAVKVIPLPLSEQTFASEPAAREFGEQMGHEWIDHNSP